MANAEGAMPTIDDQAEGSEAGDENGAAEQGEGNGMATDE